VATGTGLDAQIGFAEETTPGTGVTVTVFHEFNDESIVNEPTWMESTGLRAGGKYVKRTSRVRQIRDNVSGSVTMEAATKGQSLLWKHAVASSTTAATTGTQVHAFGGVWAGKALTVQVGRPEPVTPYTVRPFTYAGCKVTAWEFACSTGEGATLTLEFDGTSSTTATALATASYVAASSNYVFSDVSTATLGGASLFTGGLVVTGLTIRGEFPLATERQGLGFGKSKAEQLLIGQPVITASLEGEFNKAGLYDPFIAETAAAFVVTFTNGASSLSFNMPSTKIKQASPAVGGPEIVTTTVELEALDDETNAPITVTVVN
jgi:hypothetical protein